jgi:hypothetical protein
MQPVLGEGVPIDILILDNRKNLSNSYMERLVRDPFHLGVTLKSSEELAARSWNMAANIPQAQDCRGHYQALPREASFQHLLLQDFTETELDAAMGQTWKRLDPSWLGWRGMIQCQDKASLYVIFFEQNRWYQLVHPVRGIAKDRTGTIYGLRFSR